MIEVGEYVRTKDGYIFKILTKENTNYGCCGITDSNNTKYTTYTYNKRSFNDIKNKIVKHSKNIIDLIEVGDIIEINKGKYEVIYDKSLEQLGVLIPNRNHLAIRHSTLEHIFREYKNIRILTKEQYMQNCYKIPEKSSDIN